MSKTSGSGLSPAARGRTPNSKPLEKTRMDNSYNNKNSVTAWLNKHSSLIIATATTILAILTLVYVILTNSILSQMKSQTDVQFRPYVAVESVTLEKNMNGEMTFLFKIYNQGKTPATSVQSATFIIFGKEVKFSAGYERSPTSVINPGASLEVHTHDPEKLVAQCIKGSGKYYKFVVRYKGFSEQRWEFISAYAFDPTKKNLTNLYQTIRKN